MAESKRATVVVFGDVTQSPRMMNHARSLVDAGYIVDVVGYAKSRTMATNNSILSQPFVDWKQLDNQFKCCNFIDIPTFKSKGFPMVPSIVQMVVAMILSVLVKTLYFLYVGLTRIGRPQVMIVQNPPSLPTLLVTPLLAHIHGARYIIDWHNLGYSILALSLGSEHFLVTFLKRIELFLGRFGHEHLTVTKSMKEWLVEHANVGSDRVHVLYDRPNHNFHQLSVENKHEFLTRFFHDLDDESWGDESPLTKVDGVTGKIQVKPHLERDRALVVSSTSWTADEDFEVLWQAILDCELQLAKAGPRRCSLFPTILLVITGRGPLRSRYEDMFRSQPLYFFKIKTMWLPAEDYPRLLACADLGISLHKSSSNLDLPMKVVDMLGCGLPVLAYSYACIGELVEEEENGFLFEDVEHLSQQLQDLFHGFPKSSKALRSAAEHLSNKPLAPWKGHWEKVVLRGILGKQS